MAAFVVASVVGLTVVGGTTAVLYFGLLKVWQSTPPDQRRTVVICTAALYLAGGNIAALLITAPWGRQHTFLYVFGGLCGVACVFGFIGTLVAARQDLRRHRGPR